MGSDMGICGIRRQRRHCLRSILRPSGETPGLGAEIEKPAFLDQFEGKDIFAADGAFQGIKVVKIGQEPADGSAWVHAVSGGTITSQGVQKIAFKLIGTIHRLL